MFVVVNVGWMGSSRSVNEDDYGYDMFVVWEEFVRCYDIGGFGV